MTAVSTSAACGTRRRAAWLAAGTILVAAIVLRFAHVGNPLFGLDEQYYWLVGDRMLDGQLPYVDLWDRKPFGLFLLFAGFAALPGDALIAGQVAAGLCAAATGWIVMLLARERAGTVAGTMAGVFYLAGLNQLWGGGTQTPVFYNLPIAIAALLAIRDRGRLGGGAFAAMLLAGIAVQIKTIAVIEGAFLGLWLVGSAWRERGTVRPSATAGLALVAALPIILVVSFYAARGHLPEWWQANISSVLAKGAPHDAEAFGRLTETLVLALPALALAVIGLWARTGRFVRWDRTTVFLSLWVVVAAVDFVAIGGFWPHYALPLLLALSPLAASAFALRGGRFVFALVLIWPLFQAVAIDPGYAGVQRSRARAVTAALPAAVRDRCLFVYEGPVAYYTLADACIPTRFPFTGHLRSALEGRTLGVDPRAELARILATRPAAILTVERSIWGDRDPVRETMLADALARDYRIAARFPGPDPAPEERLVLWTLKPHPNG